MRFRGALSLLLIAVAAGCGGGDDASTTTVRVTVTETGTGTVPDTAPMVLTVYFLKDGRVAPVQRSVVSSPQVAGAALTELLRGPSAEEQGQGLETAIPAGTERASTSVSGGVARGELARSSRASR
jgi:spore germination protein GerM